MVQLIFSLFDYILAVGVATGLLLLILLGPLFLLALPTHYLARFIRQCACNILTPRMYLWTIGWLGTIVHETGHALFCVIFGHHITQIKFFELEPQEQLLGFVAHTYNSKSPYQVIGRLFISIGPILFGTVVIALAGWLLLGNALRDTLYQGPLGVTMFNSPEMLFAALKNILFSLWAFITYLLSAALPFWRIALFLYVTLSIGSAMALSPLDIQGAKQGFKYLVIALFIFNLLTLWLGAGPQQLLSQLSQLYSGFYILMIFALMINALFALILFPLGIIF